MVRWNPASIERQRTTRRRRVPLVTLCAVMGLLGAWGTARGGEYPLTAYAASHSMRPEYVDPASLIFQFPQRGGIMASQLFAFNLGTSTRGLGAVGNWRGQSLFLLAQDTPLDQGTSLFQAGWGGSWSPLRLGLAARVARQEESLVNLYVRDQSGTLDYNAGELSLYEASFGMGFGGDEAEVELAVEGSRIDSKLSNLYLRQDPNPIASDTTWVYLESDDDLGFAAVARIRGRFRDAVEVVVAGRWGGLRNDYDGVEYARSRITPVQVERDLERWSAGLLVSFPLRRLDWLGVAAHYEQIEDLRRLSYSRSVETILTETAMLTIALRQRLWRELHGQLGGTLAYVKEDRERRELQGNGVHRQYLNSTSDFREDFSWGVSYTWRNFDLRAAMRESLPLTNLFFALDVSVGL